MGRPSKLTPERQDFILNLVRKGLSPERAAEAAGIHRDTYYAWMARGRQDRAKHPDPTRHTLSQLLDMAASQGADVDDLGARVTRAAVAARLFAPTIYSDFSDCIKRAEAEGEAHALEQCIGAGATDWRMWMTVLERRFGWVRPEPVQESSSRGGAVDPAEALALGRLRVKLLRAREGPDIANPH